MENSFIHADVADATAMTADVKADATAKAAATADAINIDEDCSCHT
jgi:hypothetical protein